MRIGFQLTVGGHGDFDDLVEPPPHRRIQQVLVIRRGDEDAALAKRVDVLQEAVHDAPELAELVFVVSALCDHVELV